MSRVRRFAALTGLIALALSLLAPLGAAACAPADTGHEHGTTAPAPAGGHDAHGHDRHDPGSEPDERDAPCPFGPASMTHGCGAATFVPAGSQPNPAPLATTTVAAFHEASHGDRLAALALFRPPRA